MPPSPQKAGNHGASCFISYSHEGIDRDTLEFLIYVLKDFLGSNVQLYFDQHLRTGEDFSRFMRMLDEVDAVVILLTPQYKQKVSQRIGGVYQEFSRIWDRYSDSMPDEERPSSRRSHFEILPVLFSGSRQDATPEGILNLKQLDLTGLRVSRKPNGEFKLSEHSRNEFVPQIQQLAEQIHAIATVDSNSFSRLSESYYDRLFVDLKASFDNPLFIGHDYLNTLLVKTAAFRRIQKQSAYFVVGRKGSGKSTIIQVLPVIQPEKYLGTVSIIADDFNLESLFSLYNQPQFRSDVNIAVPRDRAFEFTWEALLILGVMDAVLDLSDHDRLENSNKTLIDAIREFMSGIKGIHQSEPGLLWRTEDLFNFAFISTIEFVNDCINGARTQAAVFLPDIGARFNRERYLNHVFGAELLKGFRKLIRTFHKHFLVTLDGLDTAFDRFRLDSIRVEDPQNLRSRTHFEVDWLRSLLRLAVNASSNNQDYLYRLLDFCITVPKDRFMEIRNIERDSYRYWHRPCTLNWSGIELAILLRKRLEVLVSYKSKHGASPRDRLDEVLRHKSLWDLPVFLDFEYNGKAHRMHLFLYVLRHTFWRPREVLVYYAALLALSEDLGRSKHNLTTDVIRNTVKATTRKIIESEFLAEFKSTVVNILDIVKAFKRSPIVLSYDLLSERLQPLDFMFASEPMMSVKLTDKIRFLYEIGFIGIKADKALREQFGLNLEHAFCFNEGMNLMNEADDGDLRGLEFVIHPIFSEYLRLDTAHTDLTLQYTWDYLQLGDALVSSSPGVD